MGRTPWRAYRIGDKSVRRTTPRSGRTAFLPDEEHALFNAAVKWFAARVSPPSVSSRRLISLTSVARPSVRDGGSDPLEFRRTDGMEYEEKGRRNVDVQFETIKSEKVNFGRNNFLEVARKRAKTSDGTNEFISVSRGYYLPDKSERFKRSLTIPDDPEIRAFVAEKIRTL